MRSTGGADYVTLDHVRALAAFFVFTWHFNHGLQGWPIRYEYVPALFPFSLLNQGHTGVALFMTLSGYLFAKLLDGKQIHYGAFLWNRALRLLPLLTVIIVIVGVMRVAGGDSLQRYAIEVIEGVVLPTLPNGAWSITTEFHYYLILPIFLWMLRRSRWLPLSIVAAAIALRAVLYVELGDIKTLAYQTIVGRVDQFALGMLAFQFRGAIAGRHAIALAAITAFLLAYWRFDSHGGFYPSADDVNAGRVWVLLPTIEGLGYATAIAWYDSSFSPARTGISKFVGHLGTYSYSIYVFHFFVVFAMADFVHTHIMPLTNFYVACFWSLGCFCTMAVPGYLSFRFIESPFLKLRRRYITEAPGTRPAGP